MRLAQHSDISVASPSATRVRALCVALLAAFSLGALPTSGQAAASSSSSVSRTAKAITYRRGAGVKVLMRGTDVMPRVAGEANVENKGNRVEIDAKFQGMEDATKFGFEYLAYVLWAVSPEGRAVNLGEVQIKNGSGEVKAITDMQTFAMVVTAEPYFAVSQPGDKVVLENGEAPGAENVNATYQLLAPGAYSSSNTKIENAIFGVDRKTPTELFEARNAVRIANNANAAKYAADVIAKANEQLQTAEESYRQKRDSKTVVSLARDAVQTAEEARVISVKQKSEEDAQAQAAAEKQAAEDRATKARADAAAEAARLQEAEQARQQAEAAKAEAERMKQEALTAAAEAAKAKAEAEQARQAAIAEQQAALAQKQDAIAQKEAAEAEAEKARQAAAQADAEKSQLRAELLSQLNSILQTNDSARGLIVNMSDVLFDTGSFTLKPGSREAMAKISGVLLAHPGLTLQIEGYTDSVGSDEFNQELSEERAASVRDFLAQEGVPASSITVKGFGKAQPVASNDTAEGRQRNRRVEIVVNGDAIGSSNAVAEQTNR